MTEGGREATLRPPESGGGGGGGRKKGPLRLGVLASGQGTNLEAICRAIDEGRLPAVVAVVISDRPAAKALERARRRGIPAHGVRPRDFPDKDGFFREVERLLAGANVELVVLAGFMRLLPPWFVAARPAGIMNIHPSLLPAFPGLAAPKQALDYGVRYTGCTVHFVDEGMDTGPIILQAVVPVEPGDTVETLTARIQQREHELYPEAIRLFAEGRLVLDGRRVHILAEEELPGDR